MHQQDGSERDSDPPCIAGEFFATGSEEWTARLRLLEPASPYAYRSNDVGEEGGDAFPEFEEQVFTLPAGLPGLPNDATLRGQLQAIGTPEARALDAAFAVLGDPARFGNRLRPALNAARTAARVAFVFSAELLHGVENAELQQDRNMCS